MATRRDRAGEAAGELYALPPAKFVAARDAAVKAARDTGDADTAKAIAALRKPNAVAAAANALVRAHRDEVDQLVSLGQAMREATSSLDAGQLRQLSSEQHRTITALVDTARADATDRFTDATARGLEDTLHAAMADPDTAEQLTGGQLIAGMSSSGFPGLDLAAASSGSASGGEAASRKRAGRDRPRGHELDEARRSEADAVAAADDAESAAAAAAEQAERAEQAAADAAEQVSHVEAELERARSTRNDADRAARTASKNRDKADRAADKARRAADAARDERTSRR